MQEPLHRHRDKEKFRHHQNCLLYTSLLPEDFFRLLPIRRKSGVRIRIQKKQGLPFFYRRSLKRKAFFIGIFLCLAGLYTLSQFIWNIHVEGNYANSTQTILNSLDAAGIHHGSWKKRVDCSQTASYLREQFPNLTWVSAKIEGTQLVLAVKENVDGYVIEEKADDPQNLVEMCIRDRDRGYRFRPCRSYLRRRPCKTWLRCNHLRGTSQSRRCIKPVSYTHLDVYKRQGCDRGKKPYAAFLCPAGSNGGFLEGG